MTEGRVVRPRSGWYCSPDAAPDAVAAVRAGGRLACVSALQTHGVWTLDDEKLHVACAPGRGARRPELRTHTGRLRSSGPHPAIESPLEALERLARCAPRHSFIVSADSAIHLGLVTQPGLAHVIDTSARGRDLMSAVDGRCESGTETLALLALRRTRVRLEPQVVIPGVGRVDLLIGDRLVLELDSWKWHSSRAAFERDRRRDLALSARGYLPVRVTYRRVLEDWPAVESELVSIVRSGAHRWSASTGRLASRSASGS